MSRKVLVGALTGLVLLACVASLVASVDSVCNDDVYVYFNYARNIVAGDPFAYDERGVPSEGFTSLLYLLMLVPFEALGANMMFVGIVINLLALVVVVFGAASLLRADGALEAGEYWAFCVLLLALLGLDFNVTDVIGWALETVTGPAALMLALYCGVRACADGSEDRGSSLRWSAGFMLFSLAAMLFRPENLVPVGLCGILLLYWHPRRREFVAAGALLAAGLISLQLWKLWLFGDLFPTGYYRKMATTGPWPGTDYVFSALEHYRVGLLVVGAAFAALFRLRRTRDAGDGAAPWKAILLLIVVALSSMAVVFRVTPIVGQGFRYLVNSIVILYVFAALAVVWALRLLLGRFLPAARRPAVLSLAMLALVALLIAIGVGRMEGSAASRLARLDLHRRVEVDVGAHQYLRLGYHLRERLPDPEGVTLVFGDAGCVPYAAHCRFIDSNGLTEPYIARLFREPDGEKKARLYLDYVTALDPDLIVLGWGEINRNTFYIEPNLHGPFLDDPRIEVWQGYRAHGFRYLCSLDLSRFPGYYDLHFGARPGSPHFDELATVMLDYCASEDGYVLPHLTVRDHLVRHSVTFPGLEEGSVQR